MEAVGIWNPRPARTVYRFQMSGEPNWCALPPFTTRGSPSPAPPSRTRVQFQLSSKNENGPELHGAILILGGGGGNRTRVL